jgi:hypothetical protein
MNSKTITTSADGSTTVVENDDGVPAPPPPGSQAGMPVVIHPSRHHSDDHPDPGSVFLGIVIGAGGLWATQRRRAALRHRTIKLDARGPAEATAEQARMAADVAALARRTATLETIVTDPAQRTAREIEALR